MFPVRRQVITIGGTRSVPFDVRSRTILSRVTRGEKETLAGFFELEDPAVATTVTRRTRAVSFSPPSCKNLLENVLRLVVA